MRSVRLLPAALLAFAFLAATPRAEAQSPDGLAGLLLRFFSPQNPVILQQAPAPFDRPRSVRLRYPEMPINAVALERMTCSTSGEGRFASLSAKSTGSARPSECG